MKILVIGQGFQNYDEKICDKLKLLGNSVFYFKETPQNYPLYLRMLGKQRAMRIVSEYQLNWLKEFKEDSFDLIIVIVGGGLSESFIKALKKKYFNANLVLYLWDNILRVANYHDVCKYYDKIYSFDPVDSFEYGLTFLPLFYTDEFADALINSQRKYAIFSAVMNHSDRIEVIKKITKQYFDKEMLFFVNVGRFEYYLHRGEYINTGKIEYIPKPIPKTLYISYMNQSYSTLDIQFAGQVGLTMRTFETLAKHLKLVTTNSSIKFYDFYDENNIQIINRDDPKLSFDIIQGDFANKSFFDKYSLQSWCSTICKGTNQNYLTEKLSVVASKIH